MNCTLPDSNDSKWELLKKILVASNNLKSGTSPVCNLPDSNDSEWDLWSKILNSLNRL